MSRRIFPRLKGIRLPIDRSSPYFRWSLSRTRSMVLQPGGECRGALSVNEFGVAKVSAARSAGFRDPLGFWLGVEAFSPQSVPTRSTSRGEVPFVADCAAGAVLPWEPVREVIVQCCWLEEDLRILVKSGWEARYPTTLKNMLQSIRNR